jgi:hypothetical protein
MKVNRKNITFDETTLGIHGDENATVPQVGSERLRSVDFVSPGLHSRYHSAGHDLGVPVALPPAYESTISALSAGAGLDDANYAGDAIAAAHGEVRRTHA